MIRLLFEFSAGRYHATPWGHHVNEGLVEWPPSPWRIIRALLATGYTKLGWERAPDDMRFLVEALAASEPVYRLPRGTTGHTRHYMPVRGLRKNGEQETSKVIDAFVIPYGPLVVEWPIADASFPHTLLEKILDRLGYLGRAESRVRARMARENESLPEFVVSTQRRDVDDEPVRLLAPVCASTYADWRRKWQGAPEDLLAALHMDTKTLQNGGWNIPPGARETVYWRPAQALSQVSSQQWPDDRAADRNDAALFALSTDKRRDVLPLFERAFPTMASFRRALLSIVGDRQTLGECPELTGKDLQGRPLRKRHEHAHYIPLSLDSQNPSRIDHVLVYAPMGFGPLAETALRRLRRTWAKGMDDIGVTLVGIGKANDFRVLAGKPLPELATGTRWASKTPFIPPRFLKAKGNDTLAGQVRAELRRRGLPELAVEPEVARPTDMTFAGKEAARFRRFVRTRDGWEQRAPAGCFRLTLVFDRAVQGPLCLGWGCHFGLGLFVPIEDAE